MSGKYEVGEKATLNVAVIAKGDGTAGGWVTVGDESCMRAVRGQVEELTLAEARAFARGYAAAVADVGKRPDGTSIPVYIQDH